MLMALPCHSFIFIRKYISWHSYTVAMGVFCIMTKWAPCDMADWSCCERKMDRIIFCIEQTLTHWYILKPRHAKVKEWWHPHTQRLAWLGTGGLSPMIGVLQCQLVVANTSKGNRPDEKMVRSVCERRKWEFNRNCHHPKLILGRLLRSIHKCIK